MTTRSRNGRRPSRRAARPPPPPAQRRLFTPEDRFLRVEHRIPRLEPHVDETQRIGARDQQLLLVHRVPLQKRPPIAARRGIAPRHAEPLRASRPGIGPPKRVGRCQNETVTVGPGEGTRVAFFRWVGADLELSVHAQPGARTTEVQGLHADAIKIRISARAVEGAANDALLAFVASRIAGAAEAMRVGQRRDEPAQAASGSKAPDRAHAEGVLATWLQTSS